MKPKDRADINEDECVKRIAPRTSHRTFKEMKARANMPSAGYNKVQKALPSSKEEKE